MDRIKLAGQMREIPMANESSDQIKEIALRAFWSTNSYSTPHDAIQHLFNLENMNPKMRHDCLDWVIKHARKGVINIDSISADPDEMMILDCTDTDQLRFIMGKAIAGGIDPSKIFCVTGPMFIEGQTCQISFAWDRFFMVNRETKEHMELDFTLDMKENFQLFMETAQELGLTQSVEESA